MGRPKKYFLNEHIRELLYLHYDGSSASIDTLVAVLDVPRYAVHNWVRALGIQKPRGWTREEIQFLERHLTKTRVVDIAKTLNRSTSSIRWKATELGINKRNCQGYNMSTLADAFGVSGGVVKRWIDQKLIAASHRKTERVDSDFWYISETAVKQFIIKNPMEVERIKEKVDLVWLIDMLSGGTNGLPELSNVIEIEKKQDRGISA